MDSRNYIGHCPKGYRCDGCGYVGDPAEPYDLIVQTAVFGGSDKNTGCMTVCGSCSSKVDLDPIGPGRMQMFVARHSEHLHSFERGMPPPNMSERTQLPTEEGR